jgi:Zn-dependent M28 family amino/carboxypeptidase
MVSEPEWIGQRYVSKFGWNVLTDLTEIGARLGASEGECRGHERVAAAFESAGLRDVHAQEFGIPCWERGSSSITITEPSQVDLGSISLPGSPSGNVEGAIVHLGYGLPEDFGNADLEGKIVVVRSDIPDHAERWMHRREKYFRAYQHGASVFAFQNHVEGCLPPTGSVGGGTDVVGPLPAIGVSKEVGEQLRRDAAEGELRGTVSVETNVDEGTSRNVTGTLGPETETEIIVCAHVDGHDISQGALDNASGVAVLCEVAAGLASIEDGLETQVRFIGFGSEELGLIGSQHYTESTDLSSVDTVINCDGAGRARDMQVRTCGFDDIGAVVKKVAEEFNHPIAVLPEIGAHSDHWPFVWRGIPGVQVKSDTGPGRGFGHTFADTVDKTDSRAIRDHGILVAELAATLAEDGREIAGRSSSSICDELIAEQQDVSMRVAGEWPFEE